MAKKTYTTADIIGEVRNTYLVIFRKSVNSMTMAIRRADGTLTEPFRVNIVDRISKDFGTRGYFVIESFQYPMYNVNMYN